MNRTLNILELNTSGRHSGSVSRTLSADVVRALEERHADTAVTRRDLAAGISFVDDDWIDGAFADAAVTSGLEESDTLVAELKAADVLVLGTPIYNFSIPAALKAWFDQVARPRVTFRYTDDGPVGLMSDKKAYIVLASGGVPVGSAVDFATPYLRHMLGFLGISDVTFIAADSLLSRGDEAVEAARAEIARQLPVPDPRDDRAA